MKKVFKTLSILFICFLLTSFGTLLVLDKGDLSSIHTLETDINTQTMYEIIEQIDNYRPMYTDAVDITIMSMTSKCMDSLIIDYDRLKQLIKNNDNKILVKVTSVNIENLIFVNTLSTNYNNYDKFISDVNVSFVDQLDAYLSDTSQYTYEHEIVAYVDRSDTNNIVVTLDEENLDYLNKYFYVNLLNRYTTYMNNPDIQGVSFMKTFEEVSADNLYQYIEDKNPNVFDKNLSDLYVSFVDQYISNIEVTSVLFTNNDDQPILPSEASKITINYNSQDGSVAIESSIDMLLSEYIETKQVPKDRTGVIQDMTRCLKNYVATDTKSKKANQIALENVSLADKNDIISKIKTGMTEDLFYSMQSLSSIIEEYWTIINENYFFSERTIEETIQIFNAYEDAEYRVLEIESDLDKDSFVKILAYDNETKTTADTVYSAYIKADDSIVTSLPEGEYVFRYATGDKWYGAVYMFSDTGQYMSVADVMSFHEPFKKTTIVLGKPDDSNMNSSNIDASGF